MTGAAKALLNAIAENDGKFVATVLVKTVGPIGGAWRYDNKFEIFVVEQRIQDPQSKKTADVTFRIDPSEITLWNTAEEAQIQVVNSPVPSGPIKL